MIIKLKKRQKRFLKEIYRRVMSGALAIVLLITSYIPFPTYALTGGPSQPEVQGFTPIGTSDMVDLFSGDFNYNIPLLSVDGYPINIGYSGNISMDQEASWVGLGWNLNVGTVNRAMRGIPDDFRGDRIKTTTMQAPSVSVGVNGLLDNELFGINAINSSLSAGVSAGNYSGIGLSLGLNLGVKLGPVNFGLGLNSSSDNGLSIQPSVSLSENLSIGEKLNKNLSSKVGASFNSRAGLQQLSINTSVNTKQNNEAGKSVRTDRMGVGTSNFNLMQPTFSPQIRQNSVSVSFTGKGKIGVSALGLHFGPSASFDFAAESIIDFLRSDASYGYLYEDKGQKSNKAILDFNREKDGAYSLEQPSLPMTNHTYDIFTVSGQGTGGSYRPFRNDVGRVYDPKRGTVSLGGNFSSELSTVGLGWHVGTDVVVNTVVSSSGDWTNQNNTKEKLKFKSTEEDSDFESIHFKEANEMNVTSDPNFINRVGGFEPKRIKLQEQSKFKTTAEAELQGNNQAVSNPISYNYRDLRERRNNTFQTITRKELEDGYGLNEAPSDPDDVKKDHHLAEITNLGADGSRYVYGIAAYNKVQQEVSFSVAKNIYTNIPYSSSPDYSKGLIQYDPDGSRPDNSVLNKNGIDNYFNKVETPAYAHSFLLTAIISPDYADIDNIKGPSEGDLGSWTKFSYSKLSIAEDYKWRVPLGGPDGAPDGANMASFQEGLKTDQSDDKASYIYGEKEIYYIDQIETKNFIAIFQTSDRNDALGVEDTNGKVKTSLSLKKLDKITLYARPDYEENGNNATPIKEVHFEYDYELCPNVPNNRNFVNGASSNTGKLTLKRVYFTYRNSQKGKISPYSFNYNSFNPEYNLKGYDRWGNYKPNGAPASMNNPVTDPLTNSEFPYVQQEDNALQNQYAQAWTLKKVNLPSGGEIEVSYESDDYAKVQNKKAMQMVKLIGAEGDQAGSADFGNIVIAGNDANENRRIYFEIPSGTTVEELVEGIENLFFKCLMEYPLGGDPMYEYVQGYCEIESKGTYTHTNGVTYGWIKPAPVKLADRSNETNIYSPIARTGIQYGRLQLSKYIFNEPSLWSSNTNIGTAFIQDLVNVFDNFVEGFKNPNKALWDDQKGTKFVTNKSWIRLNNTNHFKLGGGCRVDKVVIKDNWDEMTGEGVADYGQEYEYTKVDSEGNVTSSGVASYEPQIGGEENPWRQPIAYSIEKTFAPDDRFYQETPFGESFFPSANVGYSKVTVKNLDRPTEGVKRHATGRVEHEFYTCEDFPTITKRTGIDSRRQRNKPFSLNALFNIDSKDFVTASQGFYIETNDMHGKPKTQSVFQEDASKAITSVEYNYQQEIDPETGLNRINNEVVVLNPDGSNFQGMIGVHFDMVSDFRENKNTAVSAGVQVNTDVLINPFGIPPIIPITTIWPSFSSDRTRFRSVTTTKVVQRFGVLESTVATDLGSKVETKNLAYDAITGQVLLTKTKTNFEDDVYTLQYPAYWYYDKMGPAYQNIGIVRESVAFNGGNASINNAHLTFVEGDEIIIDDGQGQAERGWVVGVDINQISVLLKDGTPYNGTARIKIIRSGRRNQQMNPMASITTRINPLQSFQSNVFENVIQASAIEFSDEWRTYCDCLDDGNGGLISTNPYVMGTKGNWRPITSYLHLSPRTQSKTNGNTDIRDDGFFESYTPFYKLNNSGSWEIDKKDWTYTAEVTEFNPFGQELENRDALGRYSAATFGFNQTLATSVGANTRYRELGFDSFEDYYFSNCSDNHFKFNDYTANVTNQRSHSGDYSIKVSAGNDVIMSKDLEWCDKPGCDLDIAASVENGAVVFSPVNAGQVVMTDFNEISSGASILPSPVAGTITYSDVTIDGTVEIIFISEGCQVARTYKIINGQVIAE